VRLLFSEWFERRLTRVCDDVQQRTVGQGNFISQLHPNAGLGCHPFHLTVVASLHMYSDEQVQGHLKNLVAARKLLWNTITAVQRWNVTGGGTVQLLVRCDNLELLAHEIHTKLPKGKKWLARKGLFHITVGILDSPSADKKKFLKMMNRTCPPASFMEGDCTCSRIEFENDRDDRANPPAVQLVKAPFGAEQGGAKHHAKEATITADKLPADDNRAISMLLSEAHDLTSALPPLSATIAKESKSGFTKLAIAVDSTQGQAARQQIQRIHDCIKQAYQRNPSMTLAKLELETNAYGNCLDGEDFVWKSKLHSLHASLERESVVPSSIGNSGHVQVAPVNVEKDYGKWPNDSHSGHKNTKSGILCYMSSGNIWVTLHLDPTPMVSSNLFPGDWTYFHISLAKLERLKVKTGGKSKHSHGKKKPGSSA
jgi:hypothetical protein